jgi:HSP20 family protein
MTLLPLTRNGNGLANLDPFNRFFEDAFSAFPGTPKEDAWDVSVDVEETDRAFVFRADVPGMKKAELGVEFHDGILVLTGSRENETADTKKNWKRVERFSGSFRRAFRLPQAVDSDEVKANYTDGVLEIVVPKSESARPRSVQVS